MDVSDKTVTATGDSLDVLMTVIFQSLSQHRNVLGQVTFLNKGIRPDFLHQTLFVDDMAIVLNQQKQDVKQLRGQSYRLAFAQKHPLHRIDSVLIVGPASAKHEFFKFVQKKDRPLVSKIVGVETADHPTGGEIVAHARRYFEASDRMGNVGVDR